MRSIPKDIPIREIPKSCCSCVCGWTLHSEKIEGPTPHPVLLLPLAKIESGNSAERAQTLAMEKIGHCPDDNGRGFAGSVGQLTRSGKRRQLVLKTGPAPTLLLRINHLPRQ
jgi:hypothetical protein